MGQKLVVGAIHNPRGATYVDSDDCAPPFPELDCQSEMKSPSSVIFKSMLSMEADDRQSRLAQWHISHNRIKRGSSSAKNPQSDSSHEPKFIASIAMFDSNNTIVSSTHSHTSTAASFSAPAV
jgi:hypothetical protein